MVWTKFFISFFVMGLVGLWIFWKSFKTFSHNRKESSGFECGFESLEVPRSPFSLRFFYMLLIFLIFDVELSFFLQIPFMVENFTSEMLFIYGLMVMILLIGLMEEWREGLLSWRE